MLRMASIVPNIHVGIIKSTNFWHTIIYCNKNTKNRIRNQKIGGKKEITNISVKNVIARLERDNGKPIKVREALSKRTLKLCSSQPLTDTRIRRVSRLSRNRNSSTVIRTR